MDRDDMAALIRNEGMETVAGAVAGNLATYTRLSFEGHNLTGWRLWQGTGMVLLTLHPDAPPPPPPDPAVAALAAERAALIVEERDLLARSYHEREARERRDSCRSRINTIDHALGALPPAEAPPALPPPVAGVMCVNAGEDERGRFAAQMTPPGDPAHYPVTLLMREQWSEQAPF